MRFRTGDRVVPIFAAHKAGVITEVKVQRGGQWTVGGNKSCCWAFARAACAALPPLSADNRQPAFRPRNSWSRVALKAKRTNKKPGAARSGRMAARRAAARAGRL